MLIDESARQYFQLRIGTGIEQRDNLVVLGFRQYLLSRSCQGLLSPSGRLDPMSEDLNRRGIQSALQGRLRSMPRILWLAACQ